MQSLIYAIVVALIVSFAGYKSLYYLPYIFRHITEILAYAAVGLVIAGTGFFITHFGIIEDKQ
jgi:hypothetical protein